MKQHRIPIFETIAAFVAVCVVAILTALPSLQETGARNIDVADGVSVLRASVFRFSMDHNIEGQMQLPNENFVAQLTGRSRQDGSVDEREGKDRRYFGPYLQSIPVNPVNGLATVRVLPKDETEVILNGSAGWVFVPATGRVYPDIPGNDARGMAWTTY